MQEDDDTRVQGFLTKTRHTNGMILDISNGKKNWWTNKWIDLVEKLESGNRLTQGKNLAKKGQVIYIKIQKGLVFAKVQGDRLKPYQIRIEVNTLPEEIWGDLLAEIATNAYFVAKLYAGKLPDELNDFFVNRNVSLIPQMEQDLRAGCTCPDWANPCKHSAAVFFILANMINTDPFILFKLRGKTKEEIFEIFRVKRGNLTNDKSLISKAGVRIITDGYNKETDLLEKTSLDTLVEEMHSQERKSYEIENNIEINSTSANIWSKLEDSPFMINGKNLKRLLENSYKVAKRIASKKLSTIQE